MNDQRMEEIIGNLLRFGVILSAAIVAIGGLWYLASNGWTIADYHQFQAQPLGLRTMWSLPAPLGMIEAGLLLLIATPVARVVFAMIAFAMEHDRVYVGITIAVLVVLLYSLAAAIA